MLNNRGLAHLRLRQFGQAIGDAEQVIAAEPAADAKAVAKALYRRGLGRRGLGDLSGAVDDLLQILRCHDEPFFGVVMVRVRRHVLVRSTNVMPSGLCIVTKVSKSMRRESSGNLCLIILLTPDQDNLTLRSRASLKRCLITDRISFANIERHLRKARSSLKF